MFFRRSLLMLFLLLSVLQRPGAALVQAAASLAARPLAELKSDCHNAVDDTGISAWREILRRIPIAEEKALRRGRAVLSPKNTR